MQLRLHNLSEVVNGRVPNIISETVLKSIEDAGATDADLTRQEGDISSIVANLLGLICAVSGTRSAGQCPSLKSFKILENVEIAWLAQVSQLGEAAEASNRMSLQLLPGLEVPHWQFLHAIYNTMDLCQLVSLAMEHVASINRLTKKVDQKAVDEMLAHLRITIPEIKSKLRKAVVELQAKLSESSLEKKLASGCLGSFDAKEDIIGLELRKLIDDSWAELVSKKLLSSWNEALDGVTRPQVIYGQMSIR